MRLSTISRTTAETDITLSLNLDGTGKAHIATGVGFLEHMLRHIAVHGLFDLDVKASGDLEIDPHHTVEDVGIVLGQAFDQALGDRKGIVRMGSASVPMDEALAFVAVDLSGRPYAVIQAEWHTPSIGSLPTTAAADCRTTPPKSSGLSARRARAFHSRSTPPREFFIHCSNVR